MWQKSLPSRNLPQPAHPMAVLSTSLPTFASSSSTMLNLPLNNIHNFISLSNFTSKLQICSFTSLSNHATASYRISSRGRFTAEEEEEEVQSCSFDEAVEHFNSMEYYKCHDVLEALWNRSQEPTRTLVHGILQCAVGFHHLFNRNHKGAMMELGEGLCKLRKMNFESGPFHQFEREISAVLNFIYQTQLELAACTDDLCITMNLSERSYQLLGGYAAGQPLYRVVSDQDNNVYVVFCSGKFLGTTEQHRIKLPFLQATEDHLIKLDYN